MRTGSTLIAWVVLSFVALLTGCASPAQPNGMIARDLPLVQTARGPVFVRVTGGSKTDPLWMSKIAADDFKTALVESLRRSGLFRPPDAPGNEAYRLEVRLEVLDQPLMGFDMTVSLRADWKLVSLKGDCELWRERIVSGHTATVGDAFAGTKRVRVANEGAARKNIEQGLAKLSALDLKQ